MATNILLNKVYTAQEVVYTSEVSNVGNIDISTIISTDGTGQIRYTIQRKTANSGYRDAVDENGQKLQFSQEGAGTEGINIVSLNAAKMRIKVEVLSGSGTLNIEYESI